MLRALPLRKFWSRSGGHARLQRALCESEHDADARRVPEPWTNRAGSRHVSSSVSGVNEVFTRWVSARGCTTRLLLLGEALVMAVLAPNNPPSCRLSAGEVNVTFTSPNEQFGEPSKRRNRLLSRKWFRLQVVLLGGGRQLKQCH